MTGCAGRPEQRGPPVPKHAATPRPERWHIAGFAGPECPKPATCQRSGLSTFRACRYLKPCLALALPGPFCHLPSAIDSAPRRARNHEAFQHYHSHEHAPAHSRLQADVTERPVKCLSHVLFLASLRLCAFASNPLSLGEPELVALAGDGAQPCGVLGLVERSQRLPEAASAVLAVVRRLEWVHSFIAQPDQHVP